VTADRQGGAARGPRRRDDDRLPENASVEGKVPPFDLETEAGVLSALMITGGTSMSAIDEVRTLVAPEDFYSEAHRQICEACFGLAAESKPTATAPRTSSSSASRTAHAAAGGAPVGDSGQAHSAPHARARLRCSFAAAARSTTAEQGRQARWPRVQSGFSSR
jgi:hypothetical protein